MALELGLEKCTDVQRWEDNFARLKKNKTGGEASRVGFSGVSEAPRFTRPAVSKENGTMITDVEWIRGGCILLMLVSPV